MHLGSRSSGGVRCKDWIYEGPHGDLAAAWQQHLFVPPPGSEPLPVPDPANQQLDVESTPPEILDKLELVALEIELPLSLRRVDVLVCTRIPAGWNECVNGAAYPEGTAEVLAFVEPGTDLDVHVLTTNQAISADHGKVGAIPASSLPIGTDTALRIRLETEATFDTPKSVKDSVERGEIDLLLIDIP